MSNHSAGLPMPSSQAARSRRSPRALLAVVASFVTVVVIAGGGYAALQFFAGGGPRPAEVLPASTFALVTLDLNPSGGQKIEAIKTLRKFPAFRDQVGLKPESDVIKAIFEELYPSKPDFALPDILDLLRRRPELLGLNQHIKAKRYR